MGLAQKVMQTVESTINQTGDHRMVGDTSINEALMIEGSLSASPCVYDKYCIVVLVRQLD